MKARVAERIGFGSASVILLGSLFSIACVGLWHVTKLWPDLSLADRVLFSASLVAGCVSVPMLFLFRFDGRNVQTPRFWASIRVGMIVLPIAGASWALTHDMGSLICSIALAAWIWIIHVRRLRSADRARVP